MCGMKLEEPEKSLDDISLEKKENILSFKTTSAEKNLKRSQRVGRNGKSVFQRLKFGA